MAQPSPMTRAWRRRQELGPTMVLGQVPAASDLVFWPGAYIVRDSAGFAIRPLEGVVTSGDDLEPLGVLVHDKFPDDPDLDSVLDTRGQAPGAWDRHGHLQRGLVYEKRGIYEWRLLDGAETPIVGGKAYLVDETVVSTEADRSELWVGRFHKPLGDGTTWLVDHHENGVS